MHFDDRITTALRQRASSAAVARIQFRQLIDLLGALPAAFDHPSMDAAFDRLAELGSVIPAISRATIVRERGLRLRNPRLVALLASGDASVAEAAVAAAQLDDEQWIDLAPALPPQALAAMGDRRDLSESLTARLRRLGIAHRRLPASPDVVDAVAAAPPPAEPAVSAEADDQGIGAIVKRIEAYTRTRRPLEHPAVQRLGGSNQPVGTFDFTTDGEGRIGWADERVAPMVVGLRINANGDAVAAVADPQVRRAMRLRQPIERGTITIDGAPAIAGAWQIDARPCFDPVGGRFTGYRGRMRRPSTRTMAAPEVPMPVSQSDQIRQLLHELRTPVNAIQGFGEVIQQQLFGPTPHEYRALASGIVGDAARILAGFEELERLARLDSGVLELDAGSCDLAAIAIATTTQLNAHMHSRESRFVWKSGQQIVPAAITHADAERLLWRILAALACQAAPGEVIRLSPKMRGDNIRIRMELPQALARLDDRALFQAVATSNPQAISASMFGTGFALRLAETEARAAGGALDRLKDRLVLTLPGLTGQTVGTSPDVSDQAAG